jgi:ABC-type glycerol-3-phosphate transport system permease component
VIVVGNKCTVNEPARANRRGISRDDLRAMHPSDSGSNSLLASQYFWGSLMTGCLITSIPVAIFYNLFLDRFIAGFTVGAIK